MKIHHLGIVTKDVPGTLSALGLTPSDISETVYDPVQKNNLHFIELPANNLWLELVEPMADDASTANFAKKNGIGLHHLAIGHDDLDQAAADYRKIPYAFELGRYKIAVQAFGGNIRTLFVAVRGLILEFVQVEK